MAGQSAQHGLSPAALATPDLVATIGAAQRSAGGTDGDRAGDRRPAARLRALRELRDGLEQRLGRGLPELSMGMSGDHLVAAEEGATLVRIGTALFGRRDEPDG